MRTALDSPSYRSFVKKRNQALEQIKNKASQRTSNTLAWALGEIEDFLNFQYSKLSDGYLTHGAQSVFRNCEEKIQRTFGLVLPEITQTIDAMNRRTYLLSHIGETEALGRALQTPMKYENPKSVSSHLLRDTTIQDRVSFSLWQMGQKIMTEFRRSVLLELKPWEMLDRIRMAFPPVEPTPKRKTILRDMHEADQPKGKNYSYGILNEDEWNDLVNDYLRDYIPTFRAPNLGGRSTYIASENQYAWEVEQELTQSFVDEVRAGQVAAANEAGIQDFVWIAVLDDRTDECCYKRDGLKISQIEENLKTIWKDEDCDAVSPPIHFNCRCDIAPITDAVKDAPLMDGSDFDTWMLS